MSRLKALSGHGNCANECPLLGVADIAQTAENVRF